MKFIRTSIAFLFAFVVCVQAQDKSPKIAWKNLQERYASFFEIQPSIVNEGNIPIFRDTYYLPSIGFEWFDNTTTSWKPSNVWHCGTGYKPRIKKVKTDEIIRFFIGKDEWYEIATEDSIGMPKFKQNPEYDGTGRYRFYFRFGTAKSEVNKLISFSPEFQVVEKDFKK